MILEKIVDYKKKKVNEEKEAVSIDELIYSIEKFDIDRDFKSALKNKDNLSIIAEVKKASPSKGIIKEGFNHLEIAKSYDKNKINAISVLTEDKYFLGNTQYLTDIKKIVSVPILRKDFIISEYQIYQSKALGADAILLIAAILSKKQLERYQKISKEIGLDCLVEVHNKKELEIVLEINTEIIGINNRNLNNFVTNIETTERLIKLIPEDNIVISESGINTRKDMEFIKKLGVDGVLVGESLMRAVNIDEKIRELRGERY